MYPDHILVPAGVKPFKVVFIHNSKWERKRNKKENHITLADCAAIFMQDSYEENILIKKTNYSQIVHFNRIHSWFVF